MSRNTGSQVFLLVLIFACLLFFSFSLSTLAQESETQADMINETNLLSAAVIAALGVLPRLPTTGWIIKFCMTGSDSYCGRVAFGRNPKIGREMANPTVR